MSTQLTTIDQAILQAKQMLDAAREDGDPDDIAVWRAKLDVRLDRKLSQMKAATHG